MTQEIADDRFAARIAMKPAKRVYGFTWAKSVDADMRAKYWLCNWRFTKSNLPLAPDVLVDGWIGCQSERDRLARELRYAKKVIRAYADISQRTTP